VIACRPQVRYMTCEHNTDRVSTRLTCRHLFHQVFLFFSSITQTLKGFYVQAREMSVVTVKLTHLQKSETFFVIEMYIYLSIQLVQMAKLRSLYPCNLFKRLRIKKLYLTCDYYYYYHHHHNDSVNADLPV